MHIEGEAFTDWLAYEKNGPSAGPVYRMRHVALHRRDNKLDIYVSNVGDTPERIRRTRVGLSRPWTEWRGTPFEEVLRTEADYEGAGEPLVASVGGASHERVHQVRDPYVYEEDGSMYLVYSVAGEKGLAIAQLWE